MKEMNNKALPHNHDVRATSHMVEALNGKQPGLMNLLRSKGLGDNTLLVASLQIGHSERFGPAGANRPVAPGPHLSYARVTRSRGSRTVL